MNAQHLFVEVVQRAEHLIGRGRPLADDIDTHEDRYVAQPGSTWTVEELTALARESLIGDPED